MSVLRGKAFKRYILGIACVALGAQCSSMTGTMWPLAMGSAAAVMVTVGLVRAIVHRKP